MSRAVRRSSLKSRCINVTVLAAIHVGSVMVSANHCFDTFYRSSCPQGLPTQVLVSPWLQLMGFMQSDVSALNATLFIGNSVLWGVGLLAISETIRKISSR